MAKVRITVEFPTDTWNAMDEDSRADWVDQAVSAVNEVAHVTEVAHEMPFEE